MQVHSGQRADFFLDQNRLAQYSIVEPVNDDFAAWVAAEDRRDDRMASTRYVSPEMTGVEDLDRYGRWQQDPEVGAVWVPITVVPGWAPYSMGHWAWVSPWGWTWVDDAPWGFAPFHYGRWLIRHDRWCWAPGNYVRRPVYAPALVGWIGGANFMLSISAGRRAPGVGWFPLAPHEVFVPSYRVSPHYVQQVNITHVRHISDPALIARDPQLAMNRFDYRHRHDPKAVTVVPRDVMLDRRPVAPEAARWRRSDEVQHFVRQPASRSLLARPDVPAPARVEDRRMRNHEERGRDAAARTSVPSRAPQAAVPPPPGHRAEAPAGTAPRTRPPAGGTAAPVPPGFAPAHRPPSRTPRDPADERSRDTVPARGRPQETAPEPSRMNRPALPARTESVSPSPPARNVPSPALRTAPLQREHAPAPRPGVPPTPSQAEPRPAQVHPQPRPSQGQVYPPQAQPHPPQAQPHPPQTQPQVPQTQPHPPQAQPHPPQRGPTPHPAPPAQPAPATPPPAATQVPSRGDRGGDDRDQKERGRPR